MHICIQINDENNDLIKVFMTFRYDDEMKNCKIIEEKSWLFICVCVLRIVNSSTGVKERKEQASMSPHRSSLFVI